MSKPSAGTGRTYIVRCMTCRHCVSSVTEELSAIGGVERVEVELETGRAVIHGEGPTNEDVGTAITDARSQRETFRHGHGPRERSTDRGRLWWRRNPSACPYGRRLWVKSPHPFITRARLRDVLEPQSGERVLEVGPGTGYYTLGVAEWLRPDGWVDIFDLQQRMLDHTLRRAQERGITNLTPTRGDARDLPYADASFDAAFLVAVLGEIPDQERHFASSRACKPGGRLVVGELFGDPHWVSPGRLRERAERAGLGFDRRLGGPLGFFARFRR